MSSLSAFDRKRRDASPAKLSYGYERLAYALLFSLLVHAWLLTLTFGPGFRVLGFPWQDRRNEEPGLNVVVVPAQVAAAEPVVPPIADAVQPAPVEPPVASEPSPSASSVPIPRQSTVITTPAANPRREISPRRATETDAPPAPAPLRADRPGDTSLPPVAVPTVIALTRPDESAWAVPVTPPTPIVEPVPGISSPEAAKAGEPAQPRIAEEAAQRAAEVAQEEARRQEARQQEARRQEVTRQEAVRAENARLEAERQKAAREAAELQEAARQLTARQETVKLEASRAEAAQADAARIEAARIEAARIEAARIEAARIEAARIEAARIEAARIEAARIEAARIEAARIEAAQAEAARDARLKAIGRQLDEEAARRDAATNASGQSATLPLSLSSARRYRLWGRADPNAEIIAYAEAWTQKISMNMTFDTVREAVKLPHADPLVTVALRSDGSVESVTIVQSSGVPALDEAVRRVVQSQRPYPAFPPALARDYDVIEIRRTWYFDVAIRLY